MMTDDAIFKLNGKLLMYLALEAHGSPKLKALSRCECGDCERKENIIHNALKNSYRLIKAFLKLNSNEAKAFNYRNKQIGLSVRKRIKQLNIYVEKYGRLPKELDPHSRPDNMKPKWKYRPERYQQEKANG